jgi:hypothetical protein
VKPFSFGTSGDISREWERFTSEAQRWKPAGYDAEMTLRLRYYLDQQLDDTRAELARRFPRTHDTMVPQTLPLVRHLVREQAKVFLSTTKLDLVDDGEPLPAEVDEETKEETPHPLTAWWERTKQRMGLGLRLKRLDAYTVLMRTCGIRIGHVPGRFVAHVVFPHMVRVVMDPEAPMDLDRAYGVAIELASEGGVQGSGGSRRWEFFCARDGEGEAPMRLVVDETADKDGKVTATVANVDAGDALRAPDGRAVVPLVFFTAHTEELGLFTMEGSDLVAVNRGLNVLLTDIQHIAEQQGFGVMVLTTTAGGKAPAEIVRAPNTAISLGEGVEADFINANPMLADLVQLAQTRIKLHATFSGLPPGRVSIEARAVASGVALLIEERPLAESRQDQVEVYREAMARLWNVIWATHNAHAAEEVGGAGLLPDTLELRWTPGEMQPPVDDSAKVDNIIARKKERLISRVEAIAADRGISIEEAREVAKRIDEEDPPRPAPDPEDLLGLGGKRKALGAPDEEEEEEEDEEVPAAGA